MDSCYRFLTYTLYFRLKVCNHMTSMLQRDWLKLVEGMIKSRISRDIVYPLIALQDVNTTLFYMLFSAVI